MKEPIVPIFRRKSQPNPPASPRPSTPAPQAAPTPGALPTKAAEPSADIDGSNSNHSGPYDESNAPEDIGPQVDLGSLKIPAVNGMQVRLEIDRKTQQVTGVTLILAQPSGVSSMQLQAFAAPKREGIWDEIRGEIATGIEGAGGTADDVPGTFGRELITRIPSHGPDGQPATQAARFIGVDGPRWFLRGVLTGPAATDDTAAKVLEEVFRRTVVVRGDSARPPRDLLALSLPGQIAAAAEAEAAAQKPSLDPFKRGPEITEIH